MSEDRMSGPLGRVGQTDGEYSVCQFFTDGQYEHARRWVGGEEAVLAFRHYCTSVAARMGVTARVIVTDGGDSVIMEWHHHLGVTFPHDLEACPLGSWKGGKP
jgi:hypothetical protein